MNKKENRPIDVEKFQTVRSGKKIPIGTHSDSKAENASN
jgi:hypothetical protein